MRIPFIGSDDDDDDEFTVQGKSDGVRVESNADVDVNVASKSEIADDPSKAPQGLRVHTINVGNDSSASGGVDTGESDTTTDGPETPSSPADTPGPDSGPHNRGTFVLQNDQDFMQKVAARGINGHGKMVETVYVLAGPTYTTPTDLVCLSDPEYYGSATRRSVSFYPKKMARKVDALYPDTEHPKCIARFHTHPGGSITPSQQDQDSSQAVYDAFVDAFGSDDFEFFQGIHGLEPHGQSPNPSERENPITHPNHVEWDGERFTHKLAMFARDFRTPKDVALSTHD